MVFVADKIPSELRRIVEFLNQQMDPAEVLAVEIKQYVGHKLKTLVPRVIGQTAEAKDKKSGVGRETRQWDEDAFFQQLGRRDAEDVAVARSILDWANASSLRIWWGKGKRLGSFFPMLDHNGTSYWTMSVWTYGRLEIQFEMMKNRPPFR